MLYEEKTFILKNGKKAVLRSPRESDALALIEYLKVSAGETNFLRHYPEEILFTEEEEKEYIVNVLTSNHEVMIVCEVDGEIAGNCSAVFNKPVKMAHRATIGIALVSKYWNQGIGTKLLDELVIFSRKRGILQMELEYARGNERARRTYEKAGFVEVGIKPNAIRFEDGTFMDQVFMVKEL